MLSMISIKAFAQQQGGNNDGGSGSPAKSALSSALAHRHESGGNNDGGGGGSSPSDSVSGGGSHKHKHILNGQNVQNSIAQDHVANTETNNAATESNPNTFLTYQDHKFGLEVQYPSDWTRKTVIDNNSNNNIIRFISPQDNATDKYLESIDMSVYPATDDAPSGTQTVAELVDYYRSTLPNFQLLNSGPVIIAGNNNDNNGSSFNPITMTTEPNNNSENTNNTTGNKSYKIVYTYTYPDVGKIWGENLIATTTIHTSRSDTGSSSSNNLVVLSLNVEAAKYDIYSSIIDQVIGSFKTNVAINNANDKSPGLVSQVTSP
jgi:hypothetical protein